VLYVPPSGATALQTHVTATTNETATFSISVTAHASANTKNGTYTQLIASTSYESFGIMVQLAGLQTTASTNQRCLVDIAVGGAGSEQVLIPNLTCGNVADYVAASSKGVLYYFPIYIPSGVRVAATCQASTGGDIVNVAVRLFQHSIGPGKWVGSRVTAYGADTTNSRGTSHTPGTSSYAAATQLTASTTNPIKYMQLGFDLLSDTTGATARHLARIGYGSGPTYVASELPIKESTTIESVDFTDANFILSHMTFNIPAAQSLHISAMRDASTPEARGWIVYGVD
jgi:hypothetical protein